MPKGYSSRNQGGWHHTKKSKDVMRVNRSSLSNENNPRWRGDKVGYRALHVWIRKHYKKPAICEHCGKDPGLTRHGHTKLHWANKTKKYLRDREDWLCLCASCHKKYDLKNKIKHRYARR